MRSLLLATVGLALVHSPGALAQSNLGEVYSLVRNIYCAVLMTQGRTSCPLPSEIVVPADRNIVLSNLAKGKDILVVGRVPDEGEVKRILGQRALSGPPGQAVWVLLSPDPAMEAWAESLAPKDGARTPFSVEVVLVEASDLVGTVSQIPFALLDNHLYFPVLDSGLWLQPVGSTAATVVSVLRMAMDYGVRSAKDRKAMKNREALP